MSPKFRQLFFAAVALSGIALTTRPGAAQADEGWFGPGAPASGTPSPSGAPAVTYSQQVRSSSVDPARAPEPLAASPLLEDGNSAPDEDRDPRALTAWNQELAPYGVWVDDPSYGRVWVPRTEVVGTGFSPYVTGGRWALDEDNEWIWVSEYPFGRIVFHYGRWVWIQGRGWAWVPGLKYAPAWVTWRVPVDESYGYVGWAPLPPSYVWFGGVAVWWGYPLYYPWVFCPSVYAFSPYVHHHVIYDYHGQAHAAHYTRPYYPPRGYVRQPPRGPAPSQANIPPDAVPRQRVSARQVAAAPSPGLGIAGPGARRDSGAPRSAYSARDLAIRPAPDAASSSPAAGRTRATPQLEPTQQRRSPQPSSFERPDLKHRTPAFERPSVGRSSPRVEPMRAPLRTAPMRMSPGAVRRR